MLVKREKSVINSASVRRLSFSASRACLHALTATPPYNTAEIKLNGADAHFFKIRVDNLADEVR